MCLFFLSSTNMRESWSEKCYSQKQVYLLHLEVYAIPESRIPSPSFISRTPLQTISLLLAVPYVTEEFLSEAALA